MVGYSWYIQAYASDKFGRNGNSLVPIACII